MTFARKKGERQQQTQALENDLHTALPFRCLPFLGKWQLFSSDAQNKNLKSHS